MRQYRKDKKSASTVLPGAFLLLVAIFLAACAGNDKARELAKLSADQTALSQKQFQSAAKLEEALYKQLILIDNIDKISALVVKSEEYLTPPEYRKKALSLTEKDKFKIFSALVDMAETQRESVRSAASMYANTLNGSIPKKETPAQDAQFKALKEINGGFEELAKSENIAAFISRYAAFAKEVDRAMDEIAKSQDSEGSQN